MGIAVEEQTLKAKRERITLVLRLILVIAGAFVMIVGASGILGRAVLDTPIHDNLGFFILLMGGGVLVLTSVFKTGFFIGFFIQSL